jgi:hypothetical protein
VKFIYADSQDYVDPGYDFEKDQPSEGRQPYWDDVYPHELLGFAPYDGILVSRAIVGDHRRTGKYSESQAMRFRRVGARQFLRLDRPEFADKLIFGDCGAFSYAKEAAPPYSPSDTVDYYADGKFTHGCSVDHIIFQFEPKAKNLEGATENSRIRFDITLELAESFLKESAQLGPNFTPVGVVQGWSPPSKAEAARRLIAMGYHYLAVGGLVPLRTHAIHQAVAAIQDEVARHPQEIRLHLLGFAKADHLAEFTRYPAIASFDTTSPLIRAFKDKRRNFYVARNGGGVDYYTAIRIPQALESTRLTQDIKTGRLQQEELVRMETQALTAVRGFDHGKVPLDETLEAVLAYWQLLNDTPTSNKVALEREIAAMRDSYRHTLNDQPWKQCHCAVCRSLSIESVIFRGSNRNKRRGIHNLAVFHRHLNQMLQS